MVAKASGKTEVGPPMPLRGRVDSLTMGTRAKPNITNVRCHRERAAGRARVARRRVRSHYYILAVRRRHPTAEAAS
jgi:hypothetical protein